MGAGKSFGRITLRSTHEPDIACVSRTGRHSERFSARHYRGRLAAALGRRQYESHSLSLLFSDGDVNYELPLENDGRDLIEDLGEAREWLLKARLESR